MAEIFKFPYNASRRVHSQKPRRSKNGSPEERAAKAAALFPTSADVVPMADAREQARSEVDGRRLRGSPLRDCISTISFGATVVGKCTRRIERRAACGDRTRNQGEWIEPWTARLKRWNGGRRAAQAMNTLKALQSEVSDFPLNYRS